MKDEYQRLMEYQNGFIDYMKDMGTIVSDVIEITIIHSGKQIYCVFEYFNVTDHKKEWGIYGGIEYELDDACPIVSCYREHNGNRYEITKEARLELFQTWERPVAELSF